MLNLDWINEKISRHQTVLFDGATGTELERRGVPMNSAAWSAEAILTSPKIVQAVSEDSTKTTSARPSPCCCISVMQAGGDTLLLPAPERDRWSRFMRYHQRKCTDTQSFPSRILPSSAPAPHASKDS